MNLHFSQIAGWVSARPSSQSICPPLALSVWMELFICLLTTQRRSTLMLQRKTCGRRSESDISFGSRLHWHGCIFIWLLVGFLFRCSCSICCMRTVAWWRWVASSLSPEATGRAWRVTTAWRWRSTTECPTPGRWSASCQDYGSTAACVPSSSTHHSGPSSFPLTQYNSLRLTSSLSSSMDSMLIPHYYCPTPPLPTPWNSALHDTQVFSLVLCSRCLFILGYHDLYFCVIE